MFKIGDVVQLKSGGPQMTIDVVRPGGTSVYATWFQEGAVKRHYFICEMLKLVSA